jgi:hypothetical protein
MRLLLDEHTPPLAALTVQGELMFKSGVDLELTAGVIRITGSGALLAGSSAAPHSGRGTITLTDTDVAADAAGMGTRGILVSGGGRLALHGRGPAVAWTRLNEHAEAGSTTLRLERAVDWRAGDQIVVAPTEWYPLDLWAPQTLHDATTPTERLSAAGSSGTTLNLQTALAAFKWGRLQHATDSGLSLIRGSFAKPHPDAVDTLDERAEVGNLTRDIVIQGADDALWRSQGFGAQVMVMDRASTLQLDGVELRRVGQAGRNGRYPIHWHMLSYSATGAELGDATGHVVRNSSVWQSSQRCMVIHGTNGVELRNNICHDIKGHALFVEDGAERRNRIEDNLVLRVRSPADAQLVAQHEQRGTAGGCGASGAAVGLWLTNPDNTVRGNAVADAQGNGYWLSYAQRPFKQSAAVPLRPFNLPHAAFENNSARANGHFGLMLECVMVDDAGNTRLQTYQPTVDGSAYNYTNAQRPLLKGITSAKNRSGGYLNRVTVPDYLQWASAGNAGRAFTGAVSDGSTLKRSLIVGSSLNNRQPYPASAKPQLAVASYHSTMDIAENTFINFINRGYLLSTNGWDESSGVFGTDDYYIRPLEKGYWRNSGNRLINADPGYRALPPHLQPNYTVASRNSWTLSGAIWDPHGVVAGSGRYWVLDHPFLREPSCRAVSSTVPAGRPNGLSCAGPYYGVGSFWLNRGLPNATDRYLPMEKIEVLRLDGAGAERARWVVEQGYDSTFLGHMRHFTALRGETYVLRWPAFPNGSATKTAPRWVQLELSNLLDGGDEMLLGVHFDGTTLPSRVFVSTNPDYPVFDAAATNANSRVLTRAASRAEVQAGSGDSYWQDTANQLVWVKLTPLGLSQPWARVVPGSDDDLYRAYSLRIEP